MSLESQVTFYINELEQEGKCIEEKIVLCMYFNLKTVKEKQLV